MTNGSTLNHDKSLQIYFFCVKRKAKRTKKKKKKKKTTKNKNKKKNDFLKDAESTVVH